ncbi:MAG: ECF-type sigma factor [Roseateles sp.]
MPLPSSPHSCAAPPQADSAASTDEDAEWHRLQATAQELLPLFYADLRRIARRLRGQASASETLQTTALIHEAYLKLHAVSAWNNRQHFLRAAAMAMRQVLVDDVRSRLAQRRGGGAPHVALDAAEDVAAADATDDRIAAIDQALQRLAGLSPRLAQTVECRYFAGYTEPETAEALGVSLATVQRDWAKARAWLHRELMGAAGDRP